MVGGSVVGIFVGDVGGWCWCSAAAAAAPAAAAAAAAAVLSFPGKSYVVVSGCFSFRWRCRSLTGIPPVCGFRSD